jgi:Sec-independent protein translocase protein TatA
VLIPIVVVIIGLGLFGAMDLRQIGRSWRWARAYTMLWR